MDDDTGLRGRGHAPDDDEDAWFAPKRFGYGAGMPISREGWIASGIYMAGIIVFVFIARTLSDQGSALALIPVLGIGALTLWFVPLCARHTKGGWRWRWGGDD